MTPALLARVFGNSPEPLPLERMRQRYLVAYDYGQGGLWGYIYAESGAEIEARYPELTVVEVEPEWVTDDHRQSWESKAEDVGHPVGGLLSAILDLRSEEEAREREVGGHET